MFKKVGLKVRAFLGKAVKSLLPGRFWSETDFMIWSHSVPVEGRRVPVWASSIVGACLAWIIRQMWQAPMIAVVKDKGGNDVKIEEGAISDLLAMPNFFHTQRQLLSGIVLSLIVDGNAYVEKVRDARGKVVELWYRPSFRVRPDWKRDGSEWVGRYIYEGADGRQRVIVPEDIIHIRNGIDPQNERMGLSMLTPVLEEIATDEEFGVYARAIARMPVAGTIISPEEGEEISESDAIRITELYKEKAGGRYRGEPLVVSRAVRMLKPPVLPNEMDVQEMRQTPEERICAALGVPAAVVGFGTGMQQTKVGATMKELRAEAWEGCIIPLQDLIAEAFTLGLADEFKELGDWRIVFDRSGVRALQESQDEIAKRLSEGAKLGFVSRADWRRANGLPVVEGDEVYLVPLNVVEVDAGKMSERGDDLEARARRNGERESRRQGENANA